MSEERDDSPLGIDRTWTDAMNDLEAWLDYHYPIELFAGEFMYPDQAGIDTSNGYGPAAVKAFRLGIALARGTMP